MKITKKELVKLIQEQTIQGFIDLKYLQSKVKYIKNNLDGAVASFEKKDYSRSNKFLLDQIGVIMALQKEVEKILDIYKKFN